MFQSYENDEESNPMPSAMEAILQTFMQSLGGFGDHWNGLESTNHSFIGKVCFYFLYFYYIPKIEFSDGSGT